MIQAIVFDFGDVLAIDTEKTFEEMAHLERLPKDKRDSYEAISAASENGKRPTAELMKTMVRVFGLAVSPAQLDALMTRTAAIQPMWDLFRSLGVDYRLAILSNNQKSWLRKTAKNLGQDLRGITVFNSAEIGYSKPDPRVYRFMLRKLRLAPEEVVFVDDKAVNIAAAKKLGIHGIVFNGNVPAVIRALKALGVTVRIQPVHRGM